jgi:antitoxin CcdA
MRMASKRRTGGAARGAQQLSESPKKFGRAPMHIGKPGPKRAVNVSVDAEILSVAKNLKINLSQVLEDELRNLVKGERIRRFTEENRDAIDSYNRFIEENGIWSEKYRNW